MIGAKSGFPAWMFGLTLAVAAVLVGGCRSLWPRDEIITQDAEANIREVEKRAKEDRTLSSLAKLEEGVASYYNGEKKIPKNLDVLVPKYLAEMPVVEIGQRHWDSAKVQVYPADILKDGQIDGSMLRDTGRWGYVYTDRQVVVFIDCTHKNSRGRPWYGERGYH